MRAVKNITTHPFTFGASLISRRKTEQWPVGETCSSMSYFIIITTTWSREGILLVHRHVHFHGVIQLRELHQKSKKMLNQVTL